MRIESNIHARALLSNFELACEGAVIALTADVIWLAHDISKSGFSLWYAAVLIGLVIGLGLTVYALYRHHKQHTTHFLRNKKIVHTTRLYRWEE